MRISRIDAPAYLLAAAFVAFLIIFGARVHVIEVPNSAEMDGYVGKAEQILGGNIPRDPFHPLLYPVLSAGVGALVGGPFAGARLVSSLGAGLFVLLAYLVAKRCFGTGVGFFSLIALIANYNVITMGTDTATDMAFAGLALLVLLLALRVASRVRHSDVVLLALAFALAFFTRYSALFLAPTIAVALAISLRGARTKDKLFVPVLFAGSAVLFLIPHFMLTARVFGSPFYSENWRNLAFKMYSNYDWGYFRQASYDGMTSVILSSPPKFIVMFFRELARFFHGTLIELGGKGLPGGLCAAAALAGLYRALFALDRKQLVLVSFAFFYVTLNCMFFYAGPRFMLPMLPLCYFWGGSFLLSGPFRGVCTIGRWRMPKPAPLVAIFLCALCLTTVVHTRRYVAVHPVRELEAARAIERTYGPDVTVIGTFPYMQRYVGYRYRELADASGDEIARPELYFERLRGIVREEKADFLIIGKLFMKNRPLDLLTGERTPDFLEPVSRSSDVAVYRIRKGPLD